MIRYLFILIHLIVWTLKFEQFQQMHVPLSMMFSHFFYLYDSHFMQVKCLDLSLAIGYLFLISAFLLWGFVYRKERNDPLRTKPSINVNEESKLNSDEKQEILCISQVLCYCLMFKHVPFYDVVTISMHLIAPLMFSWSYFLFGTSKKILLLFSLEFYLKIYSCIPAIK